jgi:hypothetical protein
MIQTLLTLAAGLLALAGLTGLVLGGLARTAVSRRFWLRTIQIGMSLSGVCVLAKALLGDGPEGFYSGPLLLVAGTGITAILPARRAAEPKQ